MNFIKFKIFLVLVIGVLLMPGVVSAVLQDGEVYDLCVCADTKIYKLQMHLDNQYKTPQPTIANCSKLPELVGKSSKVANNVKDDFSSFTGETCKWEKCKWNSTNNNWENCQKQSIFTIDGNFGTKGNPLKIKYAESGQEIVPITLSEGTLVKLSCEGKGCVKVATVEAGLGGFVINNKAELKISLNLTPGLHTVNIVGNKLYSPVNESGVVSETVKIIKPAYFKADVDCAGLLKKEKLDCTKTENQDKCKKACEETVKDFCEYKDGNCTEKSTVPGLPDATPPPPPSQTVGTAGTQESAQPTFKKEEWLEYYASQYPVPENNTSPLPACAFSGTCRNINDILQLLINFGTGMFGIIGSFAFAFFVYGGFVIVTSFGNAERVKSGKDIMVASVVGLVIALSAYFIVNLLLDTLVVSDTFRGIK